MSSFLSPESIYAPPNTKKSRSNRGRHLSATEVPRLRPWQRQNLTYYDKLRIIDYHHQNRGQFNQQQMVLNLRKMGYVTLHQSTLSRLLRQEATIRQYVSEDSNRLYYKRHPLLTLPEVDAALTQWLIQKLSHNVRITGDIICAKGQYFSRLLGFPDGLLTFSHGWLDSFKTRIGLSSFVFHGDAASASPVHIEAERLRLQTLISLYAPWDVYNIDETGLFFRLVPNRGYATHQMSGVKSDKTRITYAFCANMDGSDKRQPLVIARARRPRCFNGHQGSDLGYNYFWNKKAWMVNSIWKAFLSDLNADMQRQNRYILLLCDNAPSHKHNPADYPHIRIEFLAPNLTAWIQPMDAGIIRCFKSFYKREFIRLAIARDEQSINDIYNINQLQAMQIASRAWEMVEPKTIINCWRHTGICPPQYVSMLADSHIRGPQHREYTPEAVLLEQAAARPHLAPGIFQDMLAVLDDSPQTEHEWSDQEIVDQIIAEREYGFGNHYDDEDLDNFHATHDQFLGWQY